MISLFKKKIESDLSFIGTDMHSHLLPGLDDGLQELDKTVSFIKELHHIGYTKLVCTPHIISDMYPNSAHTILPKLELVRTALKENDIPVQVEAAAEYMVDGSMEKLIQEEKDLMIFGKKYILIEMSYVAESVNIQKVIFDLKVKRLQPILAHPERYIYYHNNFAMYERFVDMGCLLQVNLLSLTGYYGKPIKNIAEKLLKNKMISLAGTDMHHEGHLVAIKKLALSKKFYKIFEGIDLKNKELL